MAIIKDGIMGPFRNKVGTVVGRKFRGLDVMTGLYEKRNNKPPTEEKLHQQTRFGMLNSFLSDASWLVNPGFKKSVRRGQSPVNAAFKFNFPHAFIEGMVEAEGEEQPVYSIQLNFPKMVLSRGPVETPNCASVAFVEEDTIRFNWLPQSENMYSRHSDRASFLIYDLEKNQVMVLLNKAVRADLGYDFKEISTQAGSMFHCWMSFSNESGKLSGDSVYAGLVG